MKRIIVRLLIAAFLANLFGLGVVEAAPDVHLQSAAAHPGGLDSKTPDGCSHACHAALHFVGMIGEPLVILPALDNLQAFELGTPVFTPPQATLFRPPRTLS